MDLGIAGKRAIVCASSKGLGYGCAHALAREGADVTINGRTQDTLKAAADAILRSTGNKVNAVVADVTTPEGRAELIASCPEPDILVNNSGGPPSGDFRSWSEADWAAAMNNNMIAQIMLIRAFVDGMAERGFGRIVNITSRSVRTPLFHLGLSNAARAGLTGFVAGLARQVAGKNVIINNLLPGPFETERQVEGLRREAAANGQSYEDILAARAAEVPAGRFGNPAEFGDACAFLCSTRSSFIVGQNLLIDGGAVRITI